MKNILFRLLVAAALTLAALAFSSSAHGQQADEGDRRPPVQVRKAQPGHHREPAFSDCLSAADRHRQIGAKLSKYTKISKYK
jgi:hypothetical protein